MLTKRGKFKFHATMCASTLTENRTAMASRGFLLFFIAISVSVTLSACGAVPSPAEPAALTADRTLSNDESRLFTETYESLIEYHIDASRADQVAIAGLSKIGTFDSTLYVERDGDQVTLHHGDESWTYAAPPPYDSAAWGKLTAQLLDAARQVSPALADMPMDRLDEAVIDRALATLDPFSHYARPEVAREWRAARDGFNGIGVVLDGGTGTRIASVMDDSPAAKAGIRIDDLIVALDGVPSASLTPDQVRERLRGPAASVVELGIQRAGLDKPIMMSIERAHLVPPSVVLSEDGNVAVLKISSFNQQTGQALIQLLHKAHQDLGPAMKGIVLDLRDNPGGLLDQSIEVASQFLDGGTVVTTIGRNPDSFQYFSAPTNHHAETLPMAVLVNGGSASASEIVASALQDSGRAVVIGTSSYGKGTVQTVLRTSNDGELTVTWAQLVPPKGYFLNHHGVVPTVCTSNLGDNANAATVLQKSPAPDLAKPRDTLDDSGWTALRALCPAQRADRAIDLALARQMVENPELYSRLLKGPPTNLAHNFAH
jgi:carboxyl-terminal processing protease